MKKLVKENYSEYICKSEKLNETRFSEDEIKFEKESVYDRTQDALFYVKEIKDNLAEVDLKELKPDFDFTLAFEKLSKHITRIAEATEINVSKEEIQDKEKNKFVEQ